MNSGCQTDRVAMMSAATNRKSFAKSGMCVFTKFVLSSTAVLTGWNMTSSQVVSPSISCLNPTKNSQKASAIVLNQLGLDDLPTDTLIADHII